MGILDDMALQIKKQSGRRYRFVRLDSENVSRKKIEGYEFLRKEDPEIKGTILEQHAGADGQVRIGGLALAKISESAARIKEKKNEAKLRKRLDSIRHGYQQAGEDIKRKLGPSHAAFKAITEEKE
jgi:hypothetical protein